MANRQWNIYWKTKWQTLTKVLHFQIFKTVEIRNQFLFMIAITCLTWIHGTWNVLLGIIINGFIWQANLWLIFCSLNFKIHEINCVYIYNNHKYGQNNEDHNCCVQLQKISRIYKHQIWKFSSNINHDEIFLIIYLKYSFCMKSHHFTKLWMHKKTICQPMRIYSQSDIK